MKKILVLTGVTGKSGGALLENLDKNQEAVKKLFPDGVKAVVRETSNTEKIDRCSMEIEKAVADLKNRERLKEVFKEADTILHIAGISRSKEVIDAAAACGVRRIIFVHTTGIYSKYKQAGEKYRRIDAHVNEVCEQYGIIRTLLRPTMIYGNCRDGNVAEFIKMVDRYPVMPVVNGARYELQPVHYKDLGRAYFDVLMHEDTTAGKDFNLSGGAPIELRDMLTEIGKNLGKKVRFVNCPYGLAYNGAVLLYHASMKKKDYRERVQRLCEPRVFSHEEAKKAFGYAPMRFEEGIVEEVEEYKRGRKA